MEWWRIPLISASISVAVAAMKNDQMSKDKRVDYKRLAMTFVMTFAIVLVCVFLFSIFWPSSQSGGAPGLNDLNILMQEVDIGDPGF